MTETFHLVVATVGETKFDGAAISATLPGAGGVMTILAHHEPIVSILKRGSLMVKVQDGETKNFEIESGVVEVNMNKVIVLL